MLNGYHHSIAIASFSPFPPIPTSVDCNAMQTTNYVCMVNPKLSRRFIYRVKPSNGVAIIVNGKDRYSHPIGYLRCLN